MPEKTEEPVVEPKVEMLKFTDVGVSVFFVIMFFRFQLIFVRRGRHTK